MTKVGIPRALLFHHYGSCWLSFLERLGVEAILSDGTTGDTITNGAVHADNETCLPVKVFSGHLLELKDKVDVMLIPRVISQGRGTCSCPKFMGLPDMARSLDEDVPPVLAPTMDLADRRILWAGEWYSIARFLGGSRLASLSAVWEMLAGLRRLEVVDTGETDTGGITVGVAGHPYNVHDPRVSMDLLERMREMGATPVTVEQVGVRQAKRQARTLSRRIFWGFESVLAGAVLHWSRTRAVSGILFITSFACGPGSMVGALLEDELRREGDMPLMTITLDEHSAEAGLITRLEAFIDMLKRSRGPRDTMVCGERDG